ncbi:4-hydroxybenzoate octaprenyltransferase [bacterium]|nr:MAG: 4-hydroxybenzoate octaprenyltransferase [bacterium]
MLLNRLWKKTVQFGKMIKFSHSVFALPFALAGATLAGEQVPLNAWKIFWIVLAMVGARNAAMGFNRLVDKKIDAANPRTKDRHLPAGKMKEREIIVFIFLFSILFIYSAFRLNMLCFALSPLALFVILSYSYTKRFTSFSHYILGVALGLAPIGAWLAITGFFAWPPIVLSLAVMFWVAGFDILYACQDFEFDKNVRVFSIPKKTGIKKALLIAKGSHVLSFILLAYLSWLVPLYFIYSAGLVIIAGLLSYEHSLVKPDDLSRLDMAFFRMNGIISIIFFIAVLGDVYLL